MAPDQRATAASPWGRFTETLGTLLRWLIPLALGLSLSWHTLTDYDIWLHHHTGEQILGGGGIPTTNSYSFTAPDHAWVDHEWLFQVVVAAVGHSQEILARASAWHALRLALTAVLLIVLLAGPRVRRATALADGTDRTATVSFLGPGPLILPAVGSLALIWPRLILRPELMAYPCFVLAVRWIDRAEPEIRKARAAGPACLKLCDPRRSLGRTFWLALLWAQIHGSYILVAALW